MRDGVTVTYSVCIGGAGIDYSSVTSLLYTYYAYPISTLPEHLHSIFPSYAKIPENTLTEKKKFLFPL